MLSNNEHSLKYLFDYKDGKIKKGLGIGCILDDYYVYKQGEFNMFLGLDNVGKTNWIIWYLTALSKKYEKKWCIWSGENKVGQLKRDIIQFWVGTNLKELKKSEIENYHNIINKYFYFIDNRKLYDHKQLLKIFEETECDGGFIDPFTGLNHNRRVAQFDRNYQICNDVREFCNRTKKTIYISIHPQTEAARRVYPPDHPLNGHIQAPRKADCEGGQVFPNRVDNFLCLHRLVAHKELWMQSEVYIYKIKDKETGGKPTNLAEPLRFDYNSGLGFTIGGNNVLK
tara:strand:+ start:1674 stop:2525 length:852 start_codon:yes stop_codon:yes gene_type:complete